MKKLIIPIVTVLLFSSVYAQTNESPASDYQWNGKKTAFQPGYVVLKSGKKLEGEISLRGSVTNVREIGFSGDMKVNFPPAALKSYGLSSTSSTSQESSGTSEVFKATKNQSPEELYSWRDMGTQMNKQIHSTKPRSGYVILQNGQRLEGELQLKKSDHVLNKINIKTKNQKHKLTPAQVKHYGLLLTVAELTKNGEKKYKDEERNFYSGTIDLVDGSKKSGVIAFNGKQNIDVNRPRLGYKYTQLFYAPSTDAEVTTFSFDKVKSIVRDENGSEVRYFKKDGGFVAEGEMDAVSFKDATRNMNAGTVVLENGTTLKGVLALEKQGTFFAQGLRIKTQDGNTLSYTASEVKEGNQIIDGETRMFTNIKGKLVEQLSNGKAFQIYRNPEPKTINQKKTNAARSFMDFSTSGVAAFAIFKDDAKDDSYETNLDSIIMSSDVKQLKEIQSAFLKLQGYSSSEELQNKSSNDKAKKYDAALSLAITGKEAREKVVIYHKEYILVNKTDQSETILHKENIKEQLNPVMMGCYTFLSLDKSKQKKYFDTEQLREVGNMLNECY